MTEQTEIKPIAMPGTHKKFLEYFKSQSFDKKLRILDVGAGHGAFTKELYDMGYDVQACDLFPEFFMFDKIECKKVDITSDFPYVENSFDLVIAIEVLEHIFDHEVFFGELNRILEPGGKLLLSTPNILSLKSRFRFLMSGFFYSFNPLDKQNHDGLQHIASRTIDQYNYVAVKKGFNTAELSIDKKQNSSRWLMVFWYPLIWINVKMRKLPTIHNSIRLLLGRLLIISFRNGNGSLDSGSKLDHF